MTIWDGTYRNIQRSGNFSYQRKAYSGHKRRPLYKPLIGIASNGKIFAVVGPFTANDSESKLLESTLRTSDHLRSLFKPNDIFILDRGFRDVIPFLHEKGYDVKMPAFIQSGKNQLECAQANQSRLVTKCPFAIEVINGKIQQQFRYFDNPVSNRALGHDFRDFQNACALLNAFSPPVLSDVGTEAIVTERLLSRVNTPNLLFELVSQKKLNNRRAGFSFMDGNSITQFPILSENDLRYIACGTYQRKLCNSYYAEHMDRSGGRFEVQVCKQIGPLGLSSVGIEAEDPFLVRAKIHSRFSNSTKYFLYILFDQSKEGVDAILEYCCQCKNGLRTTGCCAHVMVVLWYLGCGKYESEIPRLASSLEEFFVDLVLSDHDTDSD